MKKTIFVLICFVLTNVFLTGCSVKSNTQTIKYQRRLQNYLPSDASGQRIPGTIDLSDGTKTQYDASLGPKELNFEIKINNPY